ncbi:hypothetical protein HN011_003956 [Eciton burchellii]|nr:hypothetical protein HN011_003956 [Eciton burchellii]
MRDDVKIAAFLVLLFAEVIRGDAFYNHVLNHEDPCISLCEKAPTTMHGIGTFKKSCCQRGCRFFNLVDLRYGWESNNLNGTRDACDASCTEAYTDLLDRYICYIGCGFMAKQRVSDLLALFSISMCMEEGMESNILLMPDIPENDILTDPGLRKELFPGWWDSNGFKLPQTYIKTVPMDAGTVDYTLSSDYSGETEQVASMTESDWVQCALKQIKMPYWDIAIPYWLFAAIIIMCIILFMLWYCLSVDDPPTRKDMLIETYNSPKVALYIPDEAPLYQEPPPKYDHLSDPCEF